MSPETKKYIKPVLWLLALFLCVRYWSVLEKVVLMLVGAAAPLILGLCIAYVVDIPMTFYERHWFKKSTSPIANKLRRPLCLTLAILTILAIVVFVILMVLPELGEALRFLIAEIPPLVERVLKSEFVTQTVPDVLLDKLSGIDWQGLATKAADFLMSGLGSVAETVFSVVGTVVGWVVTLFVAVVFAVYSLAGKEKLRRQTNRIMTAYLPERFTEKLRYIAAAANLSFHKFIVGQCTEAVILGGLTIVGMLIFRFPYAAMIGTLVGFLALIPIAGAYISAAVGALMILTVSPIKSLLFIVFLVVLQQIEGNLIYPRVVGSSIGLPAMWVLAAISVGGSVGGIAGMLVGVPIAATLYRLLRDDVSRREAAKKPAKAAEASPEPAPEEK